LETSYDKKKPVKLNSGKLEKEVIPGDWYGLLAGQRLHAFFKNASVWKNNLLNNSENDPGTGKKNDG
jgi:hypothetical protein